MIKIKQAFGTYEIAQICQVTPPTIGRWIKDGKLPSFTTAGGHRRVWNDDLVDFLKNNNIPVPQQLGRQGPCRILIVDDEPSIRKAISRILAKFMPEVNVHEAADGFEAGHKINLMQPQVVILDLKLPGVDGIKVCRMIRQEPRFRHVKILAVSGYNTEESRRNALAAGADDFISKPFEVSHLAMKLKNLLGYSKAFPKVIIRQKEA